MSSVSIEGLPKDMVIILTGATAAGKSAAATKLCQMMPNHIEIVNGDSVQIYRGLDIGANKPSIEEQTAVKHHLIDICSPNDTFSAGDFVRQANVVIRDILRQNKTPIIVGGSTMWIQWLVEGIRDNPQASDEVYHQVQEMLIEYQPSGKWDQAIEMFKHHDEKKILNLNRNDWYRLSRHLEVAIMKKSSPPDQEDASHSKAHFERKSVLSDLNVKCFFLAEDREILYRKIDDRCVDMLRVGLFQEIKDLILHDDLQPDSMGALAIGYRQTIEYFCRPQYKPYDMNAFVEYLISFATATRNYAKRQLQWYRKDKRFLWIRANKSDHVAQEILYWCLQPEDVIRQLIDAQCRHDEVAKLRPHKRQKADQPVRDNRGIPDRGESNVSLSYSAIEEGFRIGDHSGKMRTYMSAITQIDSRVYDAYLREADECIESLTQARPDRLQLFASHYHKPNPDHTSKVHVSSSEVVES